MIYSKRGESATGKSRDTPPRDNDPFCPSAEDTVQIQSSPVFVPSNSILHDAQPLMIVSDGNGVGHSMGDIALNGRVNGIGVSGIRLPGGGVNGGHLLKRDADFDVTDCITETSLNVGVVDSNNTVTLPGDAGFSINNINSLISDPSKIDSSRKIDDAVLKRVGDVDTILRNVGADPIVRNIGADPILKNIGVDRILSDNADFDSPDAGLLSDNADFGRPDADLLRDNAVSVDRPDADHLSDNADFDRPDADLLLKRDTGYLTNDGDSKFINNTNSRSMIGADPISNESAFLPQDGVDYHNQHMKNKSHNVKTRNYSNDSEISGPIEFNKLKDNFKFIGEEESYFSNKHNTSSTAEAIHGLKDLKLPDKPSIESKNNKDLGKANSSSTSGTQKSASKQITKADINLSKKSLHNVKNSKADSKNLLNMNHISNAPFNHNIFESNDSSSYKPNASSSPKTRNLPIPSERIHSQISPNSRKSSKSSLLADIPSFSNENTRKSSNASLFAIKPLTDLASNRSSHASLFARNPSHDVSSRLSSQSSLFARKSSTESTSNDVRKLSQVSFTKPSNDFVSIRSRNASQTSLFAGKPSFQIAPNESRKSSQYSLFGNKHIQISPTKESSHDTSQPISPNTTRKSSKSSLFSKSVSLKNSPQGKGVFYIANSPSPPEDSKESDPQVIRKDSLFSNHTVDKTEDHEDDVDDSSDDISDDTEEEEELHEEISVESDSIDDDYTSTDISEDDEEYYSSDESKTGQKPLPVPKPKAADDDSEWLSVTSDDEDRTDLRMSDNLPIQFHKIQPRSKTESSLLVKTNSSSLARHQKRSSTSLLQRPSLLSGLFLNELPDKRNVSPTMSKPIMKTSSQTGIITVEQSRACPGMTNQKRPSILFQKKYDSSSDISKNYPHYQNNLVENNILDTMGNQEESEILGKQKSMVGLSQYNVITKNASNNTNDIAKSFNETIVFSSNNNETLSSSLNKYSGAMSNTSLKSLLSKSSLNLSKMYNSSLARFNKSDAAFSERSSSSVGINTLMKMISPDQSSKVEVKAEEKKEKGVETLMPNSPTITIATSMKKYEDEGPKLTLSPKTTRRAMLSTELSKSLKESIIIDYKLGKIPLPSKVINDRDLMVDKHTQDSDDGGYDDYHLKGW